MIPDDLEIYWDHETWLLSDFLSVEMEGRCETVERLTCEIEHYYIVR